MPLKFARATFTFLSLISIPAALSKAIEDTRKKTEDKAKGLGEYTPQLDNDLPMGDKSTRAYARKIKEGLETHRPNSITNKIKQIDNSASNFKADPNGGVTRVTNQQPQYQQPHLPILGTKTATNSSS